MAGVSLAVGGASVLCAAAAFCYQRLGYVDLGEKPSMHLKVSLHKGNAEEMHYLRVDPEGKIRLIRDYFFQKGLGSVEVSKDSDSEGLDEKVKFCDAGFKRQFVKTAWLAVHKVYAWGAPKKVSRAYIRYDEYDMQAELVQSIAVGNFDEEALRLDQVESQVNSSRCLQDEHILMESLKRAAPEVDVISTEIAALRVLAKTKESFFTKRLMKLLNDCKQPWELMQSKGPHSQKQVKDIINQLDNFRLNKSGDEPFRKGLKKIAQVYRNFLHARIAFPDDTKLMAERAQLQGSGLGYRFLNSEAEKILFPEKRQNKYGTATVGDYQGVHWKQNPYAPGVENAVYKLNRIISGQGPPPTRLVKVKAKSREKCFLTSKTIEGVNLHILLIPFDSLNREERLLREPYDRDDWINKVNPFNFTHMVVSGILTDPIDGKTDNFIVIKNGKQYYIVSVDNDRSFSNCVYTSENKHLIHVIYVLFFFKQMNEPIDLSFKNHFLRLRPESIVIDWLLALIEYNNRCRQSCEEKIFSDDEFQKMSLPIGFTYQKFHQERLVYSLYSKLMGMQEIMRKSHDLTHRELFRKIHPILALYYQEFERNAPDAYQTPFQLTRALADGGRGFLPVEDVLALKEPMRSKLTISTYLRKKQDPLSIEMALGGQPPEEALEEFCKQLTWQNQAPETLEKILQLCFMRVLAFQNCQILSDQHLAQIVRKFKNLEELTLIECHNITFSGLCALFAEKPKLRLVIGLCGQITIEHLLSLRQQNKAVTIHFSADVQIIMGSETQENLIHAMQAGIEEAICYLSKTHPNFDNIMISRAYDFKNSWFTYYNLSGRKIGYKRASAVANKLSDKFMFRGLNISCNCLGYKGAEAIAYLLKKSKLYQLNISRNSLAEEGAKVIARVLKDSKLTHLDLKSNYIGNEGAKAIANSLIDSRITHLDLSSNYIGNEGANAVANFLTGSKIKHLDLSSNFVSGRTRDNLEAIQKQCPQISVLL